MDSIVLAARLHGMGGAREDIRKAIESWHMSKAQIGGKTAFTDDMQARDARAAANADATRDQRNADQVATANRAKGRITDADRAKVNQITGGDNAQGNVNTSSKGVDNPAQSIKDRFDRRQAGNPSMGDTARQGYGNVKEAVGNAGARVGAAGSKALTSAGEAIGNAATAAKDKIGQVGAKASGMGGGMLNAAKRMGQGVYGGIQNAASKVPGMASAAKQKAGEIGAGVMGAAGQAGQAAMGAGRGAMNMASQLPGQIQGAYQGAKHGSQGGANRGGAYLPGVGSRTGNFMTGLKEGGISGLMEQGLVGTARAGQQSRTGFGAQQTKNMRRTYDENQQNAKTSNLMGGMKQQAAYGWKPEEQPAPAPGAPAPAAAEGVDTDGDGIPDQKLEIEQNGQTGERKVTQTTTPQQTSDPAGGNSTGDPQPAQGGGGGAAGNLLGAAMQLGRGVAPGGVLDNQNGGSGISDASGGTSAFAQAAAGGGGGGSSNSNSSGNVMNVYGTPGGGAAAPASNEAAGNPALDALTANAAERAGRTGGLARNVPLGIMTGGLSNAAGGLANAWTRRGGKRDLQNIAPQYQKAMSIVEIRQDIEKGRLGDALDSFRSGRRKKEEERTMRFLSDIERGKDWRTDNRTNNPIREPLHRDQYDRELARVVDRASVGDTTDGSSAAMAARIAPRFAPDPQPEPEEAPPEAAPEGEPKIEIDDIVERSEPWTVVENPFVNPFYSENPFTLRKEPAPQAEIEHSIIDDYIAKDLTPESEIEVSGFDTVEGDDLSLLPASVFAKSNPVGDDMSLLPSGWNADVE